MNVSAIGIVDVLSIQRLYRFPMYLSASEGVFAWLCGCCIS